MTDVGSPSITSVTGRSIAPPIANCRPVNPSSPTPSGLPQRLVRTVHEQWLNRPDQRRHPTRQLVGGEEQEEEEQPDIECAESSGSEPPTPPWPGAGCEHQDDARRQGPHGRCQERPVGGTPGRLASLAMIGSAAMTNRVDRLVNRGLIHRDTNPRESQAAPGQPHP
ncbi:hypothetical protein ACFUOZ_18065 [Paenarthrobacter sp. NPDC057355]|uniref:hypothetical protein n=1 Tax=Paenarthrobacter sp. NPDC057355 TaxID=3346105 RepID=UPI003633D556